ncbi:MAG TPA: VOC family protein [Thermoanaerobaculia bacterium]|nr:VOC family protein [Thermoanaerobaculia bacterium]
MNIRSLTPLVFVTSVPASIEFYAKLGFELGNTFAAKGAEEPTWAWLQSGDGASMMVGKADHAVDAAKQGILFYLYVDDVAAKHAELAAAGVDVSEIRTEFYAPRGEFRVVDPDGYTLMITHT